MSISDSTRIAVRNISIKLSGFEPNKVYRFYCVCVSDRGLYSKGVDITCANGMYQEIYIDFLKLERNRSGLGDDSSWTPVESYLRNTKPTPNVRLCSARKRKKTFHQMHTSIFRVFCSLLPIEIN